MAGAKVAFGHIVGDLIENDEMFYNELCYRYRFLYLHNLPFIWFRFIFKGRPFEEIQHWLSSINGTLQHEEETNSWFRPICPRLEHIWRWTEVGGPRDVKVVILGQDPYFSYEKCPDTDNFLLAANGYGFSMDKTYFERNYQNNWIPCTLRSIINMACGPDVDYVRYGDGDLTSWCRQGVLMLDLSLTTVGGKPNGHRDIGWAYVTRLVIESLGKVTEPKKVFMFWRADFAEMFADSVDERRHLAVFRCHPSSYRPGKGTGCSHGCWSDPRRNCFEEANRFLSTLFRPHYINWNPLQNDH